MTAAEFRLEFDRITNEQVKLILNNINTCGNKRVYGDHLLDKVYAASAAAHTVVDANMKTV